MEMVLEMLFLFLHNFNVKFDARELTEGKFTVEKTIPISRQVELMNKYKFVKLALDETLDILEVYVATLE